MVRLGSIPESYVPTDEIRRARARVRGRQKLVENRTEYANKIHGLLSDHGITREVKPLSVKGREFLRELSLPAPWDALLKSYLELIQTLTEQIESLALLKFFRDDLEKSYSFHRVSRIRLKTSSLANRKM